MEGFSSHVFTGQVMASRLPPELVQTVLAGKLSPGPDADRVAEAMKTWAMDLGATHYCHWFQPLTGATAEKHMAFLSPEGLCTFTGRQLLRGQADASSFPSGGLRGTAYARGCTGWDLRSPVFVKNTAAGKVLCIPSVFISHRGAALDLKTPLLRSMDALNSQALRLLKLFGLEGVSRVQPMIGAEQEYFLIDRQQYLRRPDLLCCGRTLFGAPAPKGQEMDDRYYAAIPARAGAFMAALDKELWSLGIPAMTRHNEVAPAQHEVAPHYAPAHIAGNWDLVTMERMQAIAQSQGLACLLHEKPFAGINGSGKHLNWSLACDTGENLLEPDGSPLFLLILACILQGADLYPGLLRLGAGTVGNDARLGGQEAPPAILSVYLGSRVEAMIRQFLTDQPTDPPPDSEDRNRTAPLAFTGNKFEFRMVGASDTVSMAATVLNTLAADSFCRAADALEGAADFPAACRSYTKALLLAHRRICFWGDCYSPHWPREAQNRGLPAYGSMVEAVESLVSPQSRALFSKFGVFTDRELESRARVLFETYAKRLHIEARTMLSMARRQIFPAVVEYLHRLSCQRSAENDLRRQLEALLQALEAGISRLSLQMQEAIGQPEPREAAFAFRQQVVPAMEALRQTADSLETLLPQSLWPLPDYGRLLLEV